MMSSLAHQCEGPIINTDALEHASHDTTYAVWTALQQLVLLRSWIGHKGNLVDPFQVLVLQNLDASDNLLHYNQTTLI